MLASGPYLALTREDYQPSSSLSAMAAIENDSTFVAPEGVYSMTEDYKPTIAQNLAVSAGPSLYPTRVSSVTVRFPPTKQGSGPGLAQLLGGNKDAKKDKINKEREDGASLSSSDTQPDDGPDQPSSTQEHGAGSSAAPHDGPKLFSHPPAASGKKKPGARPKHNMRTTSSTFITRIQTSEALKSLHSRHGDATFLFYNTAKSYLWIEAGSKAKDPLSRITFSAYPTCHDVNTHTASSEQLDIIIGFNTGDLVWLDPISSRYGRLNKQGAITTSPCTAVRWVPSSPTLFLVSHADGTIIVYDKEREEGTFVPQDPSSPSTDPVNGTATSSSEGSSQKEWDPTDSIFVTMPPWHPGSLLVPSAVGKSEKERAAKNPVSHWRVSRRGIVDFVFSPDVKYVAVIAEDGCLRIIDALEEQLLDCYASYFGALTCVAWSPDGRFVLTGGQDDLLTIFSPWEGRVIARCQGHSSFVSSVAFDDLRCDGRTYRFGSVGEDNKLILWDFSSGALHRPKFQATHHQRVSMSSTISLMMRRDRSVLYLPTSGASVDGNTSPRFHPAPSRNEVAVVQPVLIKNVENDILAAISFLPRCILTSTKTGHIKLWIRPLALRPRHIKGNRINTLTEIQDVMS
ncbi:catabolite repression protein creC [Crucibulum laeve]|uniref:Catabolite repression protein creC n=1 Tax=Crucibulum laeve TaxID=68775 RepID=A0A5C3MAF4_9AGAR|nr:catabolite repression protein creC [Crucibulum laeve]